MLLVPVGLSNRYQWMSKAPGEKPGVLERGYWSRYAGTGWKTGTYGRFQPVLKAGFPVVILCFPKKKILQHFWFLHETKKLR